MINRGEVQSAAEQRVRCHLGHLGGCVVFSFQTTCTRLRDTQRSLVGCLLASSPFMGLPTAIPRALACLFALAFVIYGAVAGAHVAQTPSVSTGQRSEAHSSHPGAGNPSSRFDPRTPNSQDDAVAVFQMPRLERTKQTLLRRVRSALGSLEWRASSASVYEPQEPWEGCRQGQTRKRRLGLLRLQAR